MCASDNAFPGGFNSSYLRKTQKTFFDVNVDLISCLELATLLDFISPSFSCYELQRDVVHGPRNWPWDHGPAGFDRNPLSGLYPILTSQLILSNCRDTTKTFIYAFTKKAASRVSFRSIWLNKHLKYNIESKVQHLDWAFGFKVWLCL